MRGASTLTLAVILWILSRVLDVRLFVSGFALLVGFDLLYFVIFFEWSFFISVVRSRFADTIAIILQIN